MCLSGATSSGASFQSSSPLPILSTTVAVAQFGKDFRFGGGLVTQTHHCGTTTRFVAQFPIHLSSPFPQC